MTEKVAKKIGEAYAFAHVLTETFEKNPEVMTELLGEFAGNVVEVAGAQMENLKSLSEVHAMAEIVLPKAERTGAKITKMGEMYVGDDWDDVAEVLEWMSFFVGGAIVHWQLIAGSAHAMDESGFHALAEEGASYYVELMEQLRDYAVTVGADRAQA